ncbi:MAG TPA: hypothetical protein VFG56_00225 [Candidatus Saccharimonadales bacterium]|nr:hypothetical protein [Candidatus Saccharimonadales bacterium]
MRRPKKELYMLVLKHKHHLDFPHLTFNLPRAMSLSPVMADDDTLVKSIDRDADELDNNWTLNERPDSSDLERFWQRVTSEIKTDPDWVDFTVD